MRAPGVQPDLATVVDSLIKELGKVSGVEKLHENLSNSKEVAFLSRDLATIDTDIMVKESIDDFKLKDQ